ncbi:hypothetical protein D6B98_24705 [Bradyrhizobium sp. LVM 105]|nr:hypothetical protein D6B98_24705 [Bradyrhizobium sp. LVM 105]
MNGAGRNEAIRLRSGHNDFAAGGCRRELICIDHDALRHLHVGMNADRRPRRIRLREAVRQLRR